MGSGEPIRGMEFISMYYDNHFQRPQPDDADSVVYDEREYNNDVYSRHYCRNLGFPLCPVKTTLSQVAKHLISDHLVDGVVDTSIMVEQSMLNEPGTSSILFRPHFLEAFGKWFILISGYDKYQGLYFWNVKCIQHDDESPVEFCCKMELFSANKTGQNIVWQAPVFGLDASRPQSTLSSLVIREEIMGEFQYTEANDFKLNFCGGDNELYIPGWLIRVSITMSHCDVNELSENEITSMGQSAEPNIVFVSRLVDEKESEQFFQAKKHYGIACKGCSWENGVRYSCVHCPNYHICTFCMKSGFHSEHIMIRIMNPEQNEQADCFLNGLKNGVLDDSIQG